MPTKPASWGKTESRPAAHFLRFSTGYSHIGQSLEKDSALHISTAKASRRKQIAFSSRQSLHSLQENNGWDLQKALRLLHSSNPTLFEWNNSPIVYKTTPEWAEISAIIEHFFQKKAGLYHYLSTAKKNYREYLKGDMVKLKKYFYVLRPLLACRWILEKQSPPPMLFSTLADACLDEALVPAVTDLLRLKMETPEIGLGPRIDVINDYLDASIEEIDQLIQAIPSDERVTWDELNRLFLQTVGVNVM